ncbi:helix-turn-helix domain-containing protein [Lentzea sp. NPDC034063]
MMMHHHTATNGSIGKSLMVLRELLSEPRALRLSELCGRTGLARSTTYRIIRELIAGGVVSRSTKGYEVVLDIGPGPAAGPQSSSLRRLAPYTGDVLLHTGLTSSLAVLNGEEVVYLHRVHGHRCSWEEIDESGRTPAIRSASGRLLMAYSAEAARRALAAYSRSSMEWATLDRELAQIRRNGFAQYNRSESGTVCLSVLVPLAGARIALSARGQRTQVDVNRTLHWLKQIAGAASRELGQTA